MDFDEWVRYAKLCGNIDKIAEKKRGNNMRYDMTFDDICDEIDSLEEDLKEKDRAIDDLIDERDDLVSTIEEKDKEINELNDMLDKIERHAQEARDSIDNILYEL